MPPPDLSATSEVRGSIPIPTGLPPLARAFKFAGPGLLVAVGYMDPGNWATDIEAGSRFGTELLFVVVACGLAAMLLQGLALRIGLVARRDLAQLCRERFPPIVALPLWAAAQIAIIATDIAEVLGTALAIHLLVGLPLWAGVLITGFDTLVVLGLQGRGIRPLEAIIGGLVATVTLCFVAQLVIAPPDPATVAAGLVPSAIVLTDTQALYLAIGILGATVMPHNLYLHSSIIQTRAVAPDQLRPALRWAHVDTVASLTLATLVNAAILTLAATVLHGGGARAVSDIGDAYRLLEPLTGVALAPLLFGVALLAAGQSATVTGTIAGQVVLGGFLRLRWRAWQVRLLTRSLALVPALAGVLLYGEGAVGELLVLTQVVLSLQLPFALGPLIMFAGSRQVMGDWAVTGAAKWAAWGVFGVITAADVWLVGRVIL